MDATASHDHINDSKGLQITSNPEIYNAETALILATPYGEQTPLSKLKSRRIRKPYADGSIEWLHLKKTQQQKGLHMAASVNDSDKVQSLLKDGVDPSCIDQHSRTALHLAASKGYVDIVRLLLAHGADVNAKDSIGNTPLHLAICTTHIPVVTELIKAGSDVSNLDKHGKSPLQLAYSKLRLLEKYLHKSRGEELRLQLRDIIEMMKVCSGVKSDEDELLSKLSSLDLQDNAESLHTKFSEVMTSISSLQM